MVRPTKIPPPLPASAIQHDVPSELELLRREVRSLRRESQEPRQVIVTQQAPRRSAGEQLLRLIGLFIVAAVIVFICGGILFIFVVPEFGNPELIGMNPTEFRSVYGVPDQDNDNGKQHYLDYDRANLIVVFQNNRLVGFLDKNTLREVSFQEARRRLAPLRRH
jgi:hypothetical protein